MNLRFMFFPCFVSCFGSQVAAELISKQLQEDLEMMGLEIATDRNSIQIFHFFGLMQGSPHCLSLKAYCIQVNVPSLDSSCFDIP